MADSVVNVTDPKPRAPGLQHDQDLYCIFYHCARRIPGLYTWLSYDSVVDILPSLVRLLYALGPRYTKNPEASPALFGLIMDCLTKIIPSMPYIVLHLFVCFRNGR